MMQGLRDNMKIIIWITAVVFLVGFGVLELGGVFDMSGARSGGGGPAGIVAEINGQPIRYEVFQQTYNQMVNQLQQTRQLQEGEDSYIREQAWQEIVRNTLLVQEAKKRGITVSPEEIKNAVRYTPPQFLVEAEPFQTNGQFDFRKYSAELDNPNSQVPWGQVEAIVASQLPIQKLQEQVVAAAHVSDGDVRDRFLLQNERLTLRYLRFAPDSFPIDTTKIGGADIESYYKAHIEDFSGPEEAKLEVSLVPRLPDASDFSAAKERLLSVWTELKAAPDSFEARAKIYSEIQSNVRGGAIPAPTPFDGLRPRIRQGLQDVAVGQISDIIQEERSLHFFRVNSRGIDPTTKRDMIHYNEIAIRVQPGASAIRAARDKIAGYIDDAKKNGLAAAATKHGYQAQESQWFALGKSQNDIFQRFPDIERWVFSAKIGSVSRPIPSEQGWYIYQILERREAGPRPLDKITQDVKKALVRSLKMQRATAAAEQARAAILAGEKEEAVAARFNITIGRADGVTRNGFIGALGQDAKLVGQLLAQTPGEWTPVLQGKPGAVLFHIDGRTVPSEEEFAAMAPQIRETLMTERQRVLFIEWMQNLRRSAKVKDYRENFFDV